MFFVLFSKIKSLGGIQYLYLKKRLDSFPWENSLNIKVTITNTLKKEV